MKTVSLNENQIQEIVNLGCVHKGQSDGVHNFWMIKGREATEISSEVFRLYLSRGWNGKGFQHREQSKMLRTWFNMAALWLRMGKARLQIKFVEMEAA